MKKIILIPVIFIVSVTSSLAVSNVRPTIRAERQEIKEARVTFTQQKQDFRHQSLTTVYNSIESNLEKRFANINDIIKPKVDAKIADKEKAGKDMTAAKAKLAEYSTTKYTADLAAFTAKYTELSALNPIPVGSVPQLANLAITVRTDLDNMRKVLLDAFRLAIKAK